MSEPRTIDSVPRAAIPPPAFPPLACALVLCAAFVLISLPVLGGLRHDFDEAWLMLDARAILRGLRPYADFPHHEMPLFLYLLALSGRIFGQTIFGYRMLSVVSLAGSGFLVFRFTQPLVGPVPALVAQATFLFLPLHELSVAAIPETPTIFFLLLGSVLSFTEDRRWAGVAGGAAFAVSLLIKPTGLGLVAAAVLSLAAGRRWQRIVDLAVGGVVASVIGLALTIAACGAPFVDVLLFQLGRIATHNVSMWGIDSGFADVRRLNGIETERQWAVFSLLTLYQPRFRWLPTGILIAGVLAIPIWIARVLPGRRDLQAFVVLWPVSFLLMNFVALDFVSMRYFLPFPAISSFLLAAWVWWAQQRLPALFVESTSAVAIGLLAAQFFTTFGAVQDPWYRGRLECIAGLHPRVVSFSPMLFAATGTEPGCDFGNPALTYGGFGKAFLLTESARRFAFDDERLLACLRANPRMPVVVDWGFYFFTRPGSPLRAYLDGEGARQRLFFSPDAVVQWNQPLLRMHPLR